MAYRGEMRYRLGGETGSGLGAARTEVQASVPKNMDPGRYKLSFRVLNFPGEATSNDAGIPEKLGWLPLISTWHTTGKKNIERELADRGIRGTAVSADNFRWGPARRSGTLDLFGLSPWMQDFSFDVTVDLKGKTDDDFSLSGSPGLGIAPVIVILGVVAVAAIVDAIANALGAGHIILDGVKLVARFAVEVVTGAVGEGVKAAIGNPVGTLTIVAVAAAALWLWSKSPQGRVIKSRVFG